MELLLETLLFESEGRGFDYLWGQWVFSMTSSFRPQCGPGFDSVSNRNEYQVFKVSRPRCVG